jgi:hypothetical protein
MMPPSISIAHGSTYGQEAIRTNRYQVLSMQVMPAQWGQLVLNQTLSTVSKTGKYC